MVMTRLMFGVSYNPYGAIGTTHKHAENEDDIEAEFRRWAAGLGDIKDIPIPRYIFRNGSKKIIVPHGFCDASEKAYGAIVYFSYEVGDRSTETAFIMSKTRVAPLKTQTVARLELMGDLVLVKLSNYVLSQFSSNVYRTGEDTLHADEAYLWTDSEIALSWMRRPSSTWKQFIRNRVQQIQERYFKLASLSGEG